MPPSTLGTLRGQYRVQLGGDIENSSQTLNGRLFRRRERVLARPADRQQALLGVEHPRLQGLPAGRAGNQRQHRGEPRGERRHHRAGQRLQLVRVHTGGAPFQYARRELGPHSNRQTIHRAVGTLHQRRRLGVGQARRQAQH